MASPLLEAGAIDGARGILINITGSSSLKLSEVNEASTLIQNAAHEDANIIFGAVLDENMGDEVKITVIATGFKQDHMGRHKRSASDALAPRVSVQGHPSFPALPAKRRPRNRFPPFPVPESHGTPSSERPSLRKRRGKLRRTGTVYPGPPAGAD